MEIGCRFVPAVSQGSAGRHRSAPYEDAATRVSASASSSATAKVRLSEDMVDGWTVADLATFLTNAAFRGACKLQPAPWLTIDGFALPSCEPLAGLVREGDEVTVVISGRAIQQGTLEDAKPTPALPSRPAIAGPASEATERLVKEQKAQIAELTSEVEARGSRVAELEEQVGELHRQLVAASELAAEARTAAVQVAVASRGHGVAGGRPGAASADVPPEAPAELRSKRTLAPVASDDGEARQWIVPSSTKDLRVGDVVRYRVPLPNPWRGCMQKSGPRAAKVAKLLPPSGLESPCIVLQHGNGSLDCVETSTLLDLRVQAGKAAARAGAGG